MAPALEGELADRESAEQQIMQELKEADGPLRVEELVRKIPFGQSTVRRAILRLAASGRAIVDGDFNLSSTKAP